MHTYVRMYAVFSPGFFLRRLAIANYYTNSKPSQSNGYTMLLLQYNSKRNMQVNQEYCLSKHVHMSKNKAVQDKEQNIPRKI